MGIIILAGDDTEFKVGDYIIMHREMTCIPSAPGTTYIFHTSKFTEDDIMEWADIVSYRLVVILDKKPKLTKRSEDYVVVHESLKALPDTFGASIGAMMKWRDRGAAHQVIKSLPVPVALAVWRNAHPDDIDTARRLAQVSFTLPDEYAYAVFTYSINPNKPSRRLKPKKEDYEVPHGFRLTDIYTEDLIRLAPEIANQVRITNIEALPKGVKKTKQAVLGWL
jgi:hypothetical protein